VRLATALAVGLAVGSAAAGCARSAAAPAAAPAGPAAAVPVLLRSAGLRLPLDDYQASVAESYLLARAHRALLSACMRELGLDFALPETGPPAGPRTWTDRRYGLTDPAQATRGYWAADRAAGSPTAAAVRRRTAAVTAAEGAAITGRGMHVVNGRQVPPGGCTEEARRRLTADNPAGADLDLPAQLAGQSFFTSQRDPRVRAATQQWSACMKAAGHTYAGPLDPPADRRFQHALSQPEIATARDDIACKARTNLVGVWFAVESAQQRSLIDANRPALDLARRAYHAELAIAAKSGSR
jgi:hypothetical protein